MRFIISESDNYVMIRGQDVDAANFDRWSLKHKIIYPVTNVHGDSLEQSGEGTVAFCKEKIVVKEAWRNHNEQNKAHKTGWKDCCFLIVLSLEIKRKLKSSQN